MKCKLSSRILVMMALLLFAFSVMAQDTITTDINNPIPQPDTDLKVVTPLSRLEFTLSLTVLIFGLAIIGLEIYLIKSNKISSEETIKFIIITLIITSTLFLIT